MTSDAALLHSAARLLDAHIGLKPELSFRPRLARALRDVAEARNIERAQLVGALTSDASLLDSLVDRVTVQETAFFRHPEQFETIRRVLLAEMRSPVRAWSAACANGQEAYSLAMMLDEASGTGSVLASDISHSAIRRTEAGLYTEREMSGISAERRRQHFAPEGDRWRATHHLREMVRPQRHNLLDPIPGEVASCQLVVCRNVLIYFSTTHAAAFLDRLADSMTPDAYLFVGGAETLWQLTDRFEPVQIAACFAYRRRSTVHPRRIASTDSSIAHAGASTSTPPPAPAQPIARARSAPSLVAVGASTPLSPDRSDLTDQRLALGLLASGRTKEAVVAFRQCAYSMPDDPSAHFHLGLALDDAGETDAARRAYRVAMGALDRCDEAALSQILGGYDLAEFRRLLQDRCNPPASLVKPMESS